MLVHKRTLGVLEYAPWDGSFHVVNGERVPTWSRASLVRLGLDTEEWWEIPDGSTLARTIRFCWPWFDPVVLDGELVGAKPWPAWKRYGEPEPTQEEVDAPVKKRRKGRMPRLRVFH